MSHPDVLRYSQIALPHLEDAVQRNLGTMQKIGSRLVSIVSEGKSLLVFGSGHSALFSLELYHRAGGASFVLPVVADYLMPQAGPSVVRALERTEGTARPVLDRVGPIEGEMLWLASQSGINSATVDLALYAKELGLETVAFTSVPHSSSVKSRHPSGKRLFEICDHTVDFGGFVGDASVELGNNLRAGPLSTLTSVCLGHSMIVAACDELEKQGNHCVYTSVNTPTGEQRNRDLEKKAATRDWLLR